MRKNPIQEHKKFVWIDLEMTGLNINKDVILEAAIIITDTQGNILYPGSSYVIHQQNEILATMDKWCKNTHTKNGLIKLVQESKISVADVEKILVEIINNHVKEKNGILAGNTVWQDRNFLEKYMPNVLNLLHYRLLDISTLKELGIAWYGKEVKYIKKEAHRALDDLFESINELKHYRKLLFKEQA